MTMQARFASPLERQVKNGIQQLAKPNSPRDLFRAARRISGSDSQAALWLDRLSKIGQVAEHSLTREDQCGTMAEAMTLTS